MAYYVTRHDLDEMAWGEEVVDRADTIPAARAALVAHLRDEAGSHQFGPLYSLSADHVERHWPDDRTGSIDVGYGAGLADPHLTRQQTWEHVRDCREEDGCVDAVPNYVTYSIRDDHPEAASARARGDWSLS